MSKIIAIYGSPRRKGNTAELLDRAVSGAADAGAEVEKIVLRDLKISPCLEIYGCKKSGRCVIEDDFHAVVEKIFQSQGLIVASPVFFYAVSAHMKIFMDRCQSLWVKKYWLDPAVSEDRSSDRKTLFISVGATRGKKLFDGVLLSMRYFLDTLDATLWQSLLYRELDLQGDVMTHPEYLTQAYAAGQALTAALENSSEK
jgi:multimeric flavodoxin WrbA